MGLFKMQLESRLFYKQELSRLDYQDAWKQALKETTFRRARESGITYGELFDRNINYYLLMAYKSKLYRESRA